MKSRAQRYRYVRHVAMSCFPDGRSAPPTISYASPQSWTVGVDIGTLSPTVTGSPTFALVASTLPTGVSLNAGTGAITGTPTADDGSATVTVRATNAAGTADATIAISVFTPLDLTPDFYVDVGLSTKWQDSARTTPVTADADPLGALDDLSGGNRHAKQSTSGDREVYKTSVLNSLPAMRNDGTKFLRVADDAALSPTSAFTFAAVFKTGTLAATDNYLASKWDTGENASWGIDLAKNLAKTRVFIPTSAGDASTYGDADLPADNTEKMIVVIYDGSLTGNANRLKVRINGVAQTLAFSGTIAATIADAAADLCLGCLLVSGARYGSGVLDTFAALFVGRAITTTEAQSLETYWTARYGSVLVA